MAPSGPHGAGLRTCVLLTWVHFSWAESMSLDPQCHKKYFFIFVLSIFFLSISTFYFSFFILIFFFWLKTNLDICLSSLNSHLKISFQMFKRIKHFFFYKFAYTTFTIFYIFMYYFYYMTILLYCFYFYDTFALMTFTLWQISLCFQL